uniref:C-type lectin domain-containing protein n=1 Tax=Knipowitschia caucasica TaxID=637954 RepID=A0AAV2JYX9_KNICA
MSWSEAQSYCREQFTDLDSVNDTEDLKNLKAAANGRTDAWIGLHQTSNKLTDRKWHWSQLTIRPTLLSRSMMAITEEPEAQQFCRTHHTDLMSGLDQHKLFQEQYPWPSLYCWIGLFRDTWSWSDGSDSSFRKWNSDASIYPQTKKCAALGGEGRRESDDCELKRSFICEGGPKRKKTLVKIKMSSAVDLNKFSSEILEQVCVVKILNIS